MTNAYFQVPAPYNEPVLGYEPESPEKTAIKAKLAEMSATEIEVPLIIGGEEIKTGSVAELRSPHNHQLKLGVYHQAGEQEVKQAIEAALAARQAWAAMPWEHRATVFLKAADLLSGPWRETLNVATMLGQSKTIHQAEIDAVCETVDFWRYNVHFMAQLMAEQPRSTPGIWNRVEYRPLEGFVFAATPFNFTAIAANLPTAPAMIGNVVVWLPSPKAVYANYYLYRLLEAAGLPAGVINFVPGVGSEVAPPALASPDLAGVHFTGSTAVFKHIWRQVSDSLAEKKYYPRLVGETGGKDFILAHPTADVEALVVAAVRGAFEFQGQKCSAASRMYLPRSLWSAFKEGLAAEIEQIKMGDPADFSNFMAAVINRDAFDKISGYIDYAHQSDEAEIVSGGGYDDSTGYFIEPTAIVTTNPHFKLMEEEIFGPVLTIYVYEDEQWRETVELCNQTSAYGLTGAIFGQDRSALVEMTAMLRDAAGNFYINDKPTGSIVGQQPFGGARASGTNDKAGSAMNLLRWMSARALKEAMVPPTDWRYPFMAES